LFIVHLSKQNSAFPEIPLSVAQKKEQKFYAGVRGQQPQQNGVARAEAAQTVG
jgi:hypothetical protein